MASTVRGQINLWPFKVTRGQPSKATSLIDRLKYACNVTRDPSSNRQLYQFNDCNGRFTTPQSLRDNMWSRGLCRVVKRKVVKHTGSILGRLMSMTAHVSFAVAVPSTLIVTNWAKWGAKRSFTSVNMLIHTGERPFSCSLSDYQCRRECDLKRSTHASS